MNIGIIGLGLIGKKRAKYLGKGKLIAYADILPASNITKELKNIPFYSNWKELVNNKEINLVIVATPNNLIYEISLECIKANKHLLIEKPAGVNSNEILSLIKYSKEKNIKVHVGFNHRFHPSILKAKELVEQNKLGELMFIRGLYGHGGRLGYEKEWRANPKISGGGEIIDQGCHLIDLSRWFFKSEFETIQSSAKTYFWNMEVEDNGFMILETKNKQTAFLHVSCTEWKNMFSLEIYGKVGKLKINGLGGSYGTEELIYYKMLPEMGPPESKKWIFDGEDLSWQKEIDDFYNSILNDAEPSVTLYDAQRSLEVIEKIYKDNQYDYNS